MICSAMKMVNSLYDIWIKKRGVQILSEEILVTQSSMPSYEEYIEAIKPLWDSHWITNMGMYHKELEKTFKRIFRC